MVSAALIWPWLDNVHEKWWKHLPDVLMQNEDGLVEFFEAVMKATKKEPRKVIGWVTNELLGHLKQQDTSASNRWDSHCRFYSIHIFSFLIITI